MRPLQRSGWTWRLRWRWARRWMRFASWLGLLCWDLGEAFDRAGDRLVFGRSSEPTPAELAPVGLGPAVDRRQPSRMFRILAASPGDAIDFLLRRGQRA